MSTTSRVPTFKANLVTALKAGLPSTQVEYAWPGPSTKPESLYLGEVQGTSTIPAMKAGRKLRQENYTVPVIVWVYRPEANPLAAAACEARAFELMAAVEDVLADDPQFSAVVQWALAADFSVEMSPFEKGWAVQLTREIAVQDRLI